MKKLLHPKNLPISVTIMGMVGFVLNLWTLSGGVDDEQLYTFVKFPWILLGILTVAVPVFIVLLTRPLGEPLKYSMNFPASVVSGVGTALGALVIVFGGVDSFATSPDVLGLITGVLGILGGILLFAVAYARWKGVRANFLYHGIVCLFLALRTFNHCKNWSNQPQFYPFLFTFLFQICATLAVYQLCAFDVELGDRRKSLFWSLMTVYLCLVALPSTQDVLFCGGVAIWMLTNLCSLRPVRKRRPAPVKDEENVEVPLIGTDVTMEEIKSWVDEE